ncbi:hypothetical protein [Bacillus sp. FJAT-44742]|uniref:hypothetical protein n=1 Tax=Bacillus sp. FJAT-44742 TaxID=2014005 RepID=UPI000C24366D|nr:hypothetical protein [Bacillus sp. FJAT-44742]
MRRTDLVLDTHLTELSIQTAAECIIETILDNQKTSINKVLYTINFYWKQIPSACFSSHKAYFLTTAAFTDNMLNFLPILYTIHISKKLKLNEEVTLYIEDNTHNISQKEAWLFIGDKREVTKALLIKAENVMKKECNGEEWKLNIIMLATGRHLKKSYR